MWWRVCTVIVACMGVGLVAGGQAVPWHEHLSYPGDGYWTVRVPVEVENRSDLPLAGTPVALRIQAGELLREARRRVESTALRSGRD